MSSSTTFGVILAMADPSHAFFTPDMEKLWSAFVLLMSLVIGVLSPHCCLLAVCVKMMILIIMCDHLNFLLMNRHVGKGPCVAAAAHEDSTIGCRASSQHLGSCMWAHGRQQGLNPILKPVLICPTALWCYMQTSHTQQASKQGGEQTSRNH